MILRKILWRPLSALCLAGAVALAAGQGGCPWVAAAVADDANTLRPEVGKPLQAAEKAIQEKSYPAALAKIREAEAVPGRTPHENAVIAQLRLIASLGAGDVGAAAKSLDILNAANVLTPAAKLQFTLSIAAGYFRAKDYASAATWARRYLASGGADAQAKLLLVQSLYLDKQYPAAAKAALEEIGSEEKQEKVPSDALLLVLADSARQQADWKLYETALMRLAADYPKPDYWADLLHRVPAHPGFSQALTIDVSRLALAVGTLTTAAAYMDYAELAMQAGFPGEAQSVVAQAYAKGVFGNGPDAARQARLRDLVAKAVVEDKKTLASGATEAANAASGDALVNTGLDYYGYGQFDKAVGLMEQGIAKGGLKSADAARLHLGIAYVAAGRKAKAIDVLRSVRAKDGTADLAALWILKAGGRPY
jgi:hypothetical protein